MTTFKTKQIKLNNGTLAYVSKMRKAAAAEAPKTKKCPKCKKNREFKFFGIRTFKNVKTGLPERFAPQSYCVDCRGANKSPSAKKTQVKASKKVKAPKVVKSVRKTVTNPKAVEEAQLINEMLAGLAASEPALAEMAPAPLLDVKPLPVPSPAAAAVDAIPLPAPSSDPESRRLVKDTLSAIANMTPQVAAILPLTPAHAAELIAPPAMRLNGKPRRLAITDKTTTPDKK